MGRTYALEKYQQLSNRHAPSFIRHVLASFRQHSLRATEAAQQLGLSTGRFYTLFSDYLRACARKTQRLWIPRTSGGDHTTAWPEPVTDLLKKRLACSPRCPYSFAASEVLRRLAFKLDRAQVRRWAIENGYAHATPPKRPHAPVRRWQRSQIGELWQLDASPHRWFPLCSLDFPMLNMLDDCSRVFVASNLYGRELLLSYLPNDIALTFLTTPELAPLTASSPPRIRALLSRCYSNWVENSPCLTCHTLARWQMT